MHDARQASGSTLAVVVGSEIVADQVPVAHVFLKEMRSVRVLGQLQHEN